MEARIHSSTLEESAIIERVARIVSSVRGTKPDYTRLAAELAQAVPFDIFGVVLLRHDHKAVRVTVCQLVNGVWSASYKQLPLEESMTRRMLHTPHLTINEYPSGLEGLPATTGDALSSYHQLRSTLIAPLAVEDRVLGTLELGSVHSYTYADEGLQRLIKAVVHVLANAIDSAQVGGRAAIHDRQSQVLQAVSTALTSKTDLSTILNQIVVGIARSLNVASAIFMFDRHERKLCLQAQSGLDLEQLNKVFSPCLPISEQCIIGQTVLLRKSHVTHDIATDERFPASRVFFTACGMRSIFSYPLMNATTAYGALLLFSPEPDNITPLKSEILSLFASQATIAIHNGMLLEAAHQRSRFQEAIARLEQVHEEHSQTTGTQPQDELELLARVREETRRTFGVSFASILGLISDYLLTESERDLQASLYPEQPERGEDALSTTNSDFVTLDRGDPSFEGVRDVLVAPSMISNASFRQKPLTGNLTVLAKTAEAALERAASAGELGRLLMQFKQQTSSVRDAWFVVDLNGFCTYLNPAAETLCGLLQEAMAPYPTPFPIPTQKQTPSLESVFEKLLLRIRNVDEVLLYLQDFTHSGRREIRCILAVEPVHTQPASSLHGAHEPHLLLVDSAPSDFHYQLVRYPLHNQQGDVAMYALQVQDVTEQVRDEKNRSALLSAVSHDLRTPLTTIKGAVTGLLQRDVAWSEQDRRAMLEDIDSEADHLTVLVNAIVEMSRIEMGSLSLEKEWCDANEILHGALAKLKRIVVGHRVDIQSHPSRLPLIYVDHVQLERVFQNLVENALCHSPALADIHVHFEISPEHPDILCVRVTDHGPGIPEAERERIFKSFYSLRSYGNGLGLAICKGIIDAHQGQIWIEDAPGGGACVLFTLPIRPHIALSMGEETYVTGRASDASLLLDTVLGEGQL
ncbi:MAG TPA: ATP-binding protein [Ktedonosporobacter sp.]|nr:ATP-binding protein [Ktedonosporobacter sp.]